MHDDLFFDEIMFRIFFRKKTMSKNKTDLIQFLFTVEEYKSFQK